MTPPTTILNDVLAFAVGSAFLDLHRLSTYDAGQQINQGAFVVVQMMSARFVGLQENLWRLLLLSKSCGAISRGFIPEAN
jgi:hypothetical protein